MAEVKKPDKVVYDYVVVDKEGGKIVSDGRVLAETPNKALTQVALKLAPEDAARADDLEISLRPF